MDRSWMLVPLLALLLITGAPLLAGAANNTTTAPSANETTTAPSLSQIISSAMSSPQAAAVVLIEFALGFGLGYTAMKALKYILAFIGILTLGSALSVWSLGNSTEQVVKQLGAQFKELIPLLKNLIAAFSFMVVGPTSIGFIIGIIAAMMNK